MTKGADSIMMPLLDPYNISNTTSMSKISAYVDYYATEGLRTLILAKKVLDESTYSQWNAEQEEAASSVIDRDTKLDLVNAKIEHDLQAVGSTAIEDRLQEEVPETIIALKSVGVKVWVLTGDKIETAINIGFSAGLLNNDIRQHLIDSVDIDGIKDQLKAAKDSINSALTIKHALVIAGDSLTKMESSIEVLDEFLDICESVEAVLACRVSPQ